VPAAPRLGEHTEEVLTQVLGLPGHAVARLRDAGLVAGD
jgi:2-methylfumaryl-CoA isomerase